MAGVKYDVPLVIQAQNPICWVASMAMIESYWRKVQIGIEKYTGFDPSNSSIANPARSAVDFVSKMAQYGFYPAGLYDDPLTMNGIISLLQSRGPLMFYHNVTSGLPWGAASTVTGPHAVVITAADATVNGGTLWINNPWGNKDAPYRASSVIPAAINQASTADSLFYGSFS